MTFPRLSPAPGFKNIFFFSKVENNKKKKNKDLTAEKRIFQLVLFSFLCVCFCLLLGVRHLSELCAQRSFTFWSSISKGMKTLIGLNYASRSLTWTLTCWWLHTRGWNKISRVKFWKKNKNKNVLLLSSTPTAAAAAAPVWFYTYTTDTNSRVQVASFCGRSPWASHDRLDSMSCPLPLVRVCVGWDKGKKNKKKTTRAKAKLKKKNGKEIWKCVSFYYVD